MNQNIYNALQPIQVNNKMLSRAWRRWHVLDQIKSVIGYGHSNKVIYLIYIVGTIHKLVWVGNITFLTPTEVENPVGTLKPSSNGNGIRDWSVNTTLTPASSVRLVYSPWSMKISISRPIQSQISLIILGTPNVLKAILADLLKCVYFKKTSLFLIAVYYSCSVWQHPATVKLLQLWCPRGIRGGIPRIIFLTEKKPLIVWDNEILTQLISTSGCH